MLDKFQIDEEKAQSDKRGLELKILGWLLGLIIIGSVICLILGILKAAVGALVTIAGILLAIALVIFFIYERIRWRIHLDEYDRRQKKLEQQLSERQSSSNND